VLGFTLLNTGRGYQAGIRRVLGFALLNTNLQTTNKKNPSTKLGRVAYSAMQNSKSVGDFDDLRPLF
jgi:hypothetical protein